MKKVAGRSQRDVKGCVFAGGKECRLISKLYLETTLYTKWRERANVMAMAYS